MEPLGATASILTLLAAAGQSCKFQHTLSIDLSEAPKDIQKQAVKLKCFDLSVQQLIKAYKKLPPDFEVDVVLRGEIARFESEVTSMKFKIEQRLEALRQGRKQQLRESWKWLLFDRHMTKFFQSVDHWSLIMSHAAMTAQIALSSRIDQNVVTLLSLKQQLRPCLVDPAIKASYTAPFQHTALSPVPELNSLLDPRIETGCRIGSCPERFTRYLSTCAEPVGIIPQHWTTITMEKFTVECTSGSLLSQKWSPEGQEIYQAVRASEGYGLRLITQSSSFWSARVTVLLLANYTTANSLKFNPRCSLQWSRVLALNGPHHRAVRDGDEAYLVNQFSSRALGIADVTANGNTLLHLAAGYGQSNLIDLLANAGADVNATNNSGETPLHIGLRVGKSYECARRLMSHGADVLRENKDGRTCLHTFFNDAVGQVLRYHKDSLDAFCRDKREMTILHWASWTSQSLAQDITYQSVTLQKSLSPYLALEVHGKSALHFAAERGNVSLVQHLLRQPEAPRMAAPDYEGRTLLHYATASSRCHLLYPLLITHQPEIYARDQHERTVLHYAAMRGNVSLIEHMLSLGVLVEDELKARDINEQTPLQLAQLNAKILVVELLQLHFPWSTTTAKQTVIKNVQNISEQNQKAKRVKKLRVLLQCHLIIVLLVLLVLAVCWTCDKRGGLESYSIS